MKLFSNAFKTMKQIKFHYETATHWGSDELLRSRTWPRPQILHHSFQPMVQWLTFLVSRPPLSPWMSFPVGSLSAVQSLNNIQRQPRPGPSQHQSNHISSLLRSIIPARSQLLPSHRVAVHCSPPLATTLWWLCPAGWGDRNKDEICLYTKLFPSVTFFRPMGNAAKCRQLECRQYKKVKVMSEL